MQWQMTSTLLVILLYNCFLLFNVHLAVPVLLFSLFSCLLSLIVVKYRYSLLLFQSRRSPYIPRSCLGLVSNNLAKVSVSGLNVSVSVSGWKVLCTSGNNYISVTDYTYWRAGDEGTQVSSKYASTTDYTYRRVNDEGCGKYVSVTDYISWRVTDRQ